MSDAGGVRGVVGSNVAYAPYMELGTKPHFVPAVYIGRWAELHGLGYRGVFVTGRAHKFLERAFNENQEKVVKRIGGAVTAIVKGPPKGAK
jgi:hypothetical protein